MAYIYVNPNPKGAITGDCVVRAVAIANDLDWDTAYTILSDYGYMREKRGGYLTVSVSFS